MTEKLFYKDSYLCDFFATVVSCEKGNNGKYRVTLDKTAFFPCEGGQNADIGLIGEVNVVDVIDDGEIIHVTDAPVYEGVEYFCKIDAKNKLRNLQNHSGEHIVSGLVCSKFGYDNVGFHLGREEVTVDFSGFVDSESLREIERLANEAIIKNIKIKAEVLSEEKARKLKYRSKKDIKDDIRIVTIKGYDKCACCVPHVNYTGEIGQIKILDSIHYKGGVRVWIACGFDALCEHVEKHDSVKAISNMLSIKQNEVLLGVQRLMETINDKNAKISALKEELLELKLGRLERREGNRIIFEAEADMNSMRKFANSAVKLTGGIFGIFGGNDELGYKYILASETIDLKSKAKEINTALNGNGGGSPIMVQGSANATKKQIEEYFENLK